MANEDLQAKMPTVSSLISAAFNVAAVHHSDVRRRWTNVSLRVGSLLPDSLLMVSLQQSGRIDVVLRSMEDELSANASEQNASYEYLAMLSGIWVGLVYEIVRLLKERKLVVNNVEFDQLAHALRLIRVPLEKHEIAVDRKLADEVQMVRSPSTGTENDTHVYRKDDPRRSHIMPSGASDRGSIMWHVIDVTANQAFWLERRGLSDSLLGLWDRH